MRIDDVIRYLHQARVPFRAFSYAAPESLPAVAHPLPPGAQLVDAYVVLVGGKPAIACIQSGEMIDLLALAQEAGATALESSANELQDEHRDASVPLPPLGGVFSTFRAFNKNDYVEVLYEAFARLERPRVAAFAKAGELPP